MRNETPVMETLEDLVKLGSHEPDGRMNAQCPCGDWIKTPDAGEPHNTCPKCDFEGLPGFMVGDE